MNDWTAYQTDYLFLLIGANPLPNYVAALLLAKDRSTVYLLHSGGAHGTGDVADRLKHAIQARKPEVAIVPSELDEAKSCRIITKMERLLGTVPPDAFVGLNYTGGTKAMAIHAYRAIEKAFPSGVFSYLDARTLSLTIDSQDGRPSQPIPVRETCKIKLTELLGLHGRPIDTPVQGIILPDVCRELARLHSDSPNDWHEWCEKNLRCPDNAEKFKSKTELGALGLPSESSLACVSTVFATQTASQTLDGVSCWLGWKVDKFAKWLDGSWLEHYVLDAVSRIATGCHIHDYGMNLQPISRGQGFEFDVAAMRGYQLFALSCTTSGSRGLCKSKLFEAYVRARQMGGDEARVGLVCCYRDPLALQQEVEEAWFTEGRVRVFGMKDLPDLPVRLETWFDTANDPQPL
jgi:hypothetical protein